MTQTEQVLMYMQKHGSISAAEAIENFGCYRLGARIYDLRHRGYRIMRVMEHGQNRYGDKTAYARYRMEG